MSNESDKNTQPEDGIVCPNCLLTNPLGAAFCADCGAPIGMVATTDPIQQIHAEGFAYRSAVEGPPKFIIVAGMWLIFGPIVLVTPFLLAGGVASDIPETAFFILLAIASAIILYRTTKNYSVKSRLANERSA